MDPVTYVVISWNEDRQVADVKDGANEAVKQAYLNEHQGMPNHRFITRSREFLLETMNSMLDGSR